VILNYNGAQLTLNCVDSVLKVEYPNFKVVVVDNASTDGSVAQFRAALTDPRIELLVNEKNEGYAGGNNRGIEKALEAGADYVFLSDPWVYQAPGGGNGAGWADRSRRRPAHRYWLRIVSELWSAR
jgi:hypothetical protein